MKNRQFATQGPRQKRVPVLFGNTKALVALDSIDWTRAHGKTLAGVQVNSASFGQVGDSLVIKDAHDRPLSMGKDDAEILAVQMAEHFGYTVTPPGGRRRKSNG